MSSPNEDVHCNFNIEIISRDDDEQQQKKAEEEDERRGSEFGLGLNNKPTPTFTYKGLERSHGKPHYNGWLAYSGVELVTSLASTNGVI